jgi:hypothetical protein
MSQAGAEGNRGFCKRGTHHNLCASLLPETEIAIYTPIFPNSALSAFISGISG